LIVACVTAIGCSARDSTPALDTERDSAGVTIVENPSARSDRRLGSATDSGRISNVSEPALARVVGPVMLATRDVALFESSVSALLLIDAESGATRSVGRRGQGPEEFGPVRGLWRCSGDTLVIQSGSDQKVYTASLDFVRSTAAPRLRGGAHGVSTDCAWLAIEIPNITSEDVPNDSATLAWYHPRNDSIVSVVKLAKQERQVVPYLGQRFPVPVPFADEPLVAVAQDRMYVGRTGRAEIRVYDRTGRLERIVRWSARGAPVTAKDRDDYEKARLELDARLGKGHTDQTPALAGFRLPETKPLYSQILVDDQGTLWVRKVPEGWEGLPRSSSLTLNEQPEWWVFAARGQLLGSVTMPSNVVVKEIRNGVAAGLRMDADGVPNIYSAPLRRDLVNPEPGLAVTPPES
jgi:hypothetical protein